MKKPYLIKFGQLKIKTGKLDQVKYLLNSPQNHPQSISFLNHHVYNNLSCSPEVKMLLELCDFVALDGIGIVLPARIRNLRYLPRVPMDYLFQDIIKLKLLKGNALLIGITEQENSAACKNLSCQSPYLSINGLHGFYSIDEYRQFFTEHQMVDHIFVGMGTPRSEEILLLARNTCHHAICWHIGGGTLRILAGTKKNTPKLISLIGCGWIHRIFFEPETRNRYTTGFLHYIFKLCLDSIKY